VAPLSGTSLTYDKRLCVSMDGFTLHAATRLGGLDHRGREALIRYALRPPASQERVQRGPDGLVRIGLKRPVLAIRRIGSSWLDPHGLGSTSGPRHARSRSLRTVWLKHSIFPRPSR
jgi:hypothetical protein